MASTAQEPSEADRYLLWSVGTRFGAREHIDTTIPSPQSWAWNFEGPPPDPFGPNEAPRRIVRYHSSMSSLEGLGLVWRGEVSNDPAFIQHGYVPHEGSIRRGWGMQPSGVSLWHDIRNGEEPERWKRNAEFARDLKHLMHGWRP